MSEQVAIYLLASLAAVSNIFWAVQCHKLLCKLMSKDFGEYQYYKDPSKASAVAPSQEEKFDLAELERENESYLNELNGMLPR